MRPGRFGWLTAALIAVLVVFGIGDAAAHLTKYRHGETFSAFIWALEEKVPAVRVLVGGACLTLFTHLVFHLP